MVAKGKACQGRNREKCILSDNCRLHNCSLQIKFGEFKHYFPCKTKAKVSKHDSTLSEIGLEIERSDTSSDHVCHACARKIRNTFEFHNFIYS